MKISCAFPTTMDSPELVQVAEELGYRRAWLYDTPQQSPDVWMSLALAAVRTSRIELGPGVLIPSLRHPMVNAAATATLVGLAPGRVVVGFGTGFTGRRAMGYRAIPWSFVEAYVSAYLALLRGEVVEWEGARMQMLHPAGHGPARPVRVPVLIGALGPKGADVARRLGDGVFLTTAVPEFAPEFDEVAYLCWGTVLDDGEDAASPGVRERGGPGTVLAYHATYEFAGPEAVAALPGGPTWLAEIDRTPVEERHLAVHVQHCVGLNDADRAAWDAGGSALLPGATVSGTAAQVADRVQGLAEAGVTEVVYQPCGPDVRRELERFRAATAT